MATSFDECHHGPAVSIDGVLSAASARFITGLTATPYRRDGHQPIITMQCGPVRHTARTGTHRQSAGPDRLLVRRDTNFNPEDLSPQPSIQEVYGALARDPGRLSLLASDARDLLRERRAVIDLTERREHLDRLADELSSDGYNVVVLHGGVRPKARRSALAQLAELPDDEPRLVLATGRYIGEGFDDPRLDTLILTMPIAWKGTSSGTPAAFTAPTRPSATSGSTTTSTPRFQFSDACTLSAYVPTRTWATPRTISSRSRSRRRSDSLAVGGAPPRPLRSTRAAAAWFGTAMRAWSRPRMDRNPGVVRRRNPNVGTETLQEDLSLRAVPLETGRT